MQALQVRVIRVQLPRGFNI